MTASKKNPKSEIRNPKQIQMTKEEIIELRAFVLVIGISIFEFVSDFGFAFGMNKNPKSEIRNKFE